MLPVGDLARSLAFYREYFSLVELRRIELTTPARTLVFLGLENDLGGDGGSMQLELWYEPARHRPQPTEGPMESIPLTAIPTWPRSIDSIGPSVGCGRWRAGSYQSSSCM
ncbi:MAG: hypothetical protein EB018_09500, partial [Gammaproteobacteria bacterium]|nr:hypothetical protein [Gammaproteobacteria bacterium]